MDFNDTPEEAAFRVEAAAWLTANAQARSAGDPPDNVLGGEVLSDEEIATAKEWQARKARDGWACLTWPKELGGRGATPIQAVIWGQEESKYITPPNIFGIGIGMAGPTVLAHGNDEQKKRWIPRLASGEDIWCQLFSEPSAGSDLAGLRSTAVQDGDDWIINGQKIWTTGAQFCKWGILVVRSDPNAVKHAGLTYFVVDMESDGVEIRPITQINGGQGFNEVFFTDVRIPDDQRLGAVGNGWAVALTTLMNERASIGGNTGSGSFSQFWKHVTNVQLDGQPAIRDSAVRQRVAEFYTRFKGLEYTGRRTLTALSKGAVPGPEASLGKLVGGVLIQELGAFGIDLCGESGGTMDEESTPSAGQWQQSYLAIPGLRIAGGTDEILRNIIAERVMGLPPETRMDKGIPFKDVPSGPPGR
jgi:alkylation response protein AidB-like acyl-CoA dehydrogenase